MQWETAWKLLMAAEVEIWKPAFVPRSATQDKLQDAVGFSPSPSAPSSRPLLSLQRILASIAPVSLSQGLAGLLFASGRLISCTETGRRQRTMYGSERRSAVKEHDRSIPTKYLTRAYVTPLPDGVFLIPQVILELPDLSPSHSTWPFLHC